MIALSTAARSTRARLVKAVLWLCAILFVLQVSSALAHHHDQAHDLADCAICHVGSSAQAALPSVPPELLAVFLVIAYLAARRPEYVNVIPQRYLIPSRQAPPASMSL